MGEKVYTCCILGAGPAGLAAGLELANHGVTDILILDRNSRAGGLSRTEVFDGARFDIGPHRFFSKNAEVNRLWHEMLGDQFRPVDRLTRIFYRKRYFNYPLKAWDALAKLGPLQALQALLSFAAARWRTPGGPDNFEEWITRRFGRKLFEVFFKTYTEKVWGIPCDQIGAEWAAQRIKDLDILRVLKQALLGNGGKKIKTLVEQFHYPLLGAGQMYEAMAARIAERGGEILLNHAVTRVHLGEGRVHSLEIAGPAGEKITVGAQRFFSSIPLTRFLEMCHPPESPEVRTSAGALYFRDHITVNLLVGGRELFPDQWVYIHSPEVKSARLANYNNFSPRMVKRENLSALSVEYFVFQHEDLWRQKDEDLQELAVDELAYLGLVKKGLVERSWVLRETECYPTYYIGFQEPYRAVRSRLEQLRNLAPIGRGGMYKYNNQDHSILSGILAARNFLGLPGTPFNLWNINIDAEYQENGRMGDGHGSAS